MVHGHFCRSSCHNIKNVFGWGVTLDEMTPVQFFRMKLLSFVFGRRNKVALFFIWFERQNRIESFCPCLVGEPYEYDQLLNFLWDYHLIWYKKNICLILTQLSTKIISKSHIIYLINPRCLIHGYKLTL
jgi:hypothetical protein